jgi:hypothetical protein
LNQIGGGPTPASCTQAPGEHNNDPPVDPVLANDNFCATSNQFVTTSPWPFQAKANSGGTTGDGGPDTKFGVAEFMEGGINLTALGFGDTCFSSFMAETRSSHSVTSTLSDFAIGGFGACQSGLTTTPANGSGTALTDSDTPPNGLPDIQIGTGSAGVNVTDNASVTVTGIGTWTGTVSFFICGPIASPATCDTGGVAAGVKNVSNLVTTATSNVVNLTSVGRYCWRGVFESPTDGVPDSTDASTGECFEVKPVTPTLSTTGGADVTLGTAITDTATLSGTANQPGTNGGTTPGQAGSQYPSINATNGALAGGTISWTLRGPGTCNDAGLTITGTPATVSGDNTYGPVSATPTAIGTYTWVATYSGSPNTLGAAGSCPPGANDGDEAVTVTGVATLATAQKWLPNDTAHITGPTGTTLSGTVTFTLYNDGSCGTNGGTSQYTVQRNVVTDADSNPVPTANDRYVSTTNTAFFVTTANDAVAWSWKVSYDDANLTDPADKCETTTPAFTLSD